MNDEEEREIERDTGRMIDRKREREREKDRGREREKPQFVSKPKSLWALWTSAACHQTRKETEENVHVRNVDMSSI